MDSKYASKIISGDVSDLAGSLAEYKEKFEGKCFLITGAGGFLGKYLVYLLRYMNENILTKPCKGLFLDNFVIGDEEEMVSDGNLIFIRHNVIEPFETDQNIDYIIHAAGIASPLYYTKFPIETMDVTTIGTRNMLELARAKNVKGFLFTSSSEVYGDPDDKFVPTPETYNGNVSIYGPRACYDESKRFAEILCLSFYRVYDVPVKIVRYFNVFGPGMRLNDYRVIPNFIEHALRKEALTIHGNGENTRSYCYINDALEATLKLLFSIVNGEAFNIGNPALEISLNDLGKAVQELFDYPVRINHVPPPHAVYASSDPKRRCPDISKIRSVIQYNPRYDLKKGLGRTIDWYKEFLKIS
ncbi:MAG: NAD-dependent epimerase/dehydratase family protein [Bacteroidia bacterium]|nr:NAD-dependent epimerase/dehydratase family protein [Bacteroidia bacterium]